MSLTVNASVGSVTDIELAVEAWADFVRAIDELVPDGVAKLEGTLAAAEGADAVSVAAFEIRDLDSDKQRTKDSPKVDKVKEPANA